MYVWAGMISFFHTWNTKWIRCIKVWLTHKASDALKDFITHHEKLLLKWQANFVTTLYVLKNTGTLFCDY